MVITLHAARMCRFRAVAQMKTKVPQVLSSDPLDMNSGNVLFSSCTTGPMGSGKTASLLGLVRILEQRDERDFIVITHELDSRFDDGVKSRNGKTHQAIKCRNAEQIKAAIRGQEKITLTPINKVVIDECQFFGPDLVDLVKFCGASKYFFCFGLEEDSDGKPFGAMPGLIKLLPLTNRLFAECYVNGCDMPATKTRRTKHHGEQVLLGDDNYTASCSKHHKTQETKNV